MLQIIYSLNIMLIVKRNTGKDYNVQHQMCLTFLKVKLVCFLL